MLYVLWSGLAVTVRLRTYNYCIIWLESPLTISAFRTPSNRFENYRNIVILCSQLTATSCKQPQNFLYFTNFNPNHMW